MADELEQKSPQERLAQSRRAITRYLRRQNGHADEEHFSDDPAAGPNTPRRDGAGAWWPVLKHAGRSWWRHHPAHLAGEMAVPVIQAYAREKPLQLLGVAAGVGAAAVLIRPWRLVSVNRLVSGVMGSTELSGVVLSVLNSNLKKEKR
jgi:hypothetical protein